MDGQSVLVTGAASGIGLTCAKSLLDGGICVAAVDIQGDRLKTALPESNPNLHVVVADLSNPKACQGAVDETIDRFGRIDALIHFGAMHSKTPWDSLTSEEWDQVIAVNLKGTFFMAQAVARQMVERKRGRIVLIASDSARMGGVAGGPAYVASKGGVIGLTRTLAQALGPRGVTVNAINPGLVETSMTAAWPEELKQEAVRRTPLGRLGRPDDIADVAQFLISDGARYICGEVIEVNGGSYFD